MQNRFFRLGEQGICLVDDKRLGDPNSQHLMIYPIHSNPVYSALKELLASCVPLHPSVMPVILNYVLLEYTLGASRTPLELKGGEFVNLQGCETLGQFQQSLGQVIAGKKVSSMIHALLKPSEDRTLSWQSCGERVSFVELLFPSASIPHVYAFEYQFELLHQIRQYPEAILMSEIGSDRFRFRKLLQDDSHFRQAADLFPNGLPTRASEYDQNQREFVCNHGILTLYYTKQKPTIFDARQSELDESARDSRLELMRLVRDSSISAARILPQKSGRIIYVNTYSNNHLRISRAIDLLNDPNVSYEATVIATPCFELRYRNLKLFLQNQFVYDAAKQMPILKVSLAVEDLQKGTVIEVQYEPDEVKNLPDMSRFLVEKVPVIVLRIKALLKTLSQPGNVAETMLNLLNSKNAPDADHGGWKLYQPEPNSYAMYSMPVPESKVANNPTPRVAKSRVSSR